MRILAVADVWQGSDAYAYVRAFRRLGHSIRVLPPESFIPSQWRSRPLRLVRRALEPWLVREYSRALLAEAARLRPHLLFVFKGRYVAPTPVRQLRASGTLTVNFYPDVSVFAHGRLIPRTLPEYDWVFTTKSFGLDDMRRMLGIERASFLPHGFDPEVHVPVDLDAEDHQRYSCDVSFVGTWSPKKQRFLEALAARWPAVRLRVWGDQWAPARYTLGARIEGQAVFGIEYAKAMLASKINLCILSEARHGASSGDRTTARTFQIPGTGAFMLHERTDELALFFRESAECACFSAPEELADRVDHYLRNQTERAAIARAGRERALRSGYAVDDRARELLGKVADLIRERIPVRAWA